MLQRRYPEDLAKVGVEGSNPFARSKFIGHLAEIVLKVSETTWPR